MSIHIIIINIFLFVSLVAMIFVIGYAIPKKQSLLIRQIGLLTFITFIYVFGYLIELNTTLLEAKLFWNLVQYLSIPIIPAVWLLIALNFIGLKLKTYQKVLIFLIPIMTYIMRFTNNFHQLFYLRTYLEDTQIGPLMSIDYGVFYYIQSGYIILCFIFANILYITRYIKADSNQRKRLISISLSAFAPWLGFILNLFLGSKYPLDYTAIFFPIAIILIIISLKEEHRISISPFARNLMFKSSEEGVIVVNREKIIVDYNDKASEIFGNIKNLNNQDINFLSNIAPEFPIDMNLNQKTKMKVSKSIYQVFLRGILSESNDLLGYVYSFSDITENINYINQLRKNEEKIKKMVYFDFLTGVHNRNYLEYFIKEKNHLLCRFILMIDMNELKFVNDNYGHQKGDQLIISLANLIVGKLKEKDELIRLSGDEFLIFSCMRSEEQLKVWIQSLIEDALSIQYLSFAIGYTEVEKDKDFSKMYKLAEDRMYQNKREMKIAKR